MHPSALRLPEGPGNPTIYHEKQQSACCGRHALNNLLGGYHFSDAALGDMAMTLYDEERALHASTAEGVHSADYAAFIGADNPYVDLSGNFSIEVLERALSAHGVGLQRENALVQAALLAPEQHAAYLLNRSDHWFAIRRIGGHWIDLNSVKPMPEHISDFYMSAFLAQMKSDNYTIFVVTGALPAANRAFAPYGCLENSWHSLAEVLSAVEEVKQRGHFRAGAVRAAAAQAESDPELARALRESMMEGGSGGTGGGASSSAGARGHTGSSSSSLGMDAGQDEEAELQAALRASMEVPAPSFDLSGLLPAAPASSSSSSSSSSSAPAPAPALQPTPEQLRARIECLAGFLRPEPVGDMTAMQVRVGLKLPGIGGPVAVQRMFHQGDLVAQLFTWAEHAWLCHKVGGSGSAAAAVAASAAAAAAAAAAAGGGAGGDEEVVIEAPAAPPPALLPFALLHGPGRLPVAASLDTTLLAAAFAPSASFTLVAK